MVFLSIGLDVALPRLQIPTFVVGNPRAGDQPGSLRTMNLAHDLENIFDCGL